MEAPPVFMKDFQEAQFYCSTDQQHLDLSTTTMIPFITGFEQPVQQLTHQDHQQNNNIHSASLFANYTDIYSLCASNVLNQEAKENENSANLKHQEIKAEYNGHINNTTSFSELIMIKESDQQKHLMQEQIEFNRDGQSQVFNQNSYNNTSSSTHKPIEVKDGECTNDSNSGSEHLSLLAGQKMAEQQTDAERGMFQDAE